MNSDVEDILELYHQIVSNLDLDLQQNITINDLCNEKNYCQIFRIMFPFLEREIDNIQKERNPVGEKLQGLIEFLSYPVLTMDLSHISGPAIAQGDLRHLYNFLQILLELSKLYKEQAGHSSIEQSNSGNQHEFGPSQDGESDNIEFINENGDYDGQSQEDSEIQYEGTQQGRTIARTKSEKELPQNNNQDIPIPIPNQQKSSGKKDGSSQKSKQKALNSKENQKKAIEDNLISVTQKQQRYITSDPNYNDKIKKQTKKQKQNEMGKQAQQKQQQEFEIPEISDIDQEFLEQYNEEDILQLDENDETRQKYMREKQKEEILRVLEERLKQGDIQGGEPDIDDFIEFQIKVIKNSLNQMGSGKLQSDEKETIDQILKNRNKYKEFLKDYLKNYQQKQKKQTDQKQRSSQSQRQQVIMNQKKKDDLKKEFENEHLSMYYKLRDEKLNYLRKIHRIIFELEKRKIIDEKKDHLQMRRQQNIMTRNALSSVENAYNDKISMLKEKLQNERKERHIAGVAQRQILSKLEKDLREDKIKQIQELKDVWRQEKERFDYLMKDDGELEKRILQIYKKY